MPIITIKLAKGRTIDTKRKLVKALTNVVVEALDVKPEWVSVLIDEFDRENWSTGGALHSDRFGDGHGKQGNLTE